MELSKRDVGLLREVRRTLAVLDEGALSVFAAAIEPVAALLGSRTTCLYLAKEGDTGFDLPNFAAVGDATVRLEREMRVLLRQSSDDFGHYNPIRPEPWNQNRVVDWKALEPRSLVRGATSIAKLLDSLGLPVEDQMRVLVCDGPSLLAWVGGYFDEPPKAREKWLLKSLIAPFRRRLSVDRAFERGRLLAAALGEALETICAEAFVVRQGGSPVHMNEAGRRWFDKSPTTAVAAFRDAIREGARSMHFVVRELKLVAGPRYFMLLSRRPSVVAPLESVAARYGLTQREGRVFELLVRGAGNARIGAELGISDRTVEAHVAAILRKADVGSRAALIAKLAGFE